MDTKLFMRWPSILLCILFSLICGDTYANRGLFKQARSLQHDGEYDKAIQAYTDILTHNEDIEEITDKEVFFYTEALVQLMNTFQSKGDTEGCISTLDKVFEASAVLQSYCLRDFYAVKGYALSRTENMKEAEETILKAFTLPLRNPTPENYFRDYAYAAAVFYSNPDYQVEVVQWCQEALQQAELCKNNSGVQWVKSMLGSIYKRNGNLNEALILFHQSKEEAETKNDNLGVLNSLNSLVDLFLYWDIPEYANMYASQAIDVESRIVTKNPMISAQTFINKGRALHQLGEIDSLYIYANQARTLCQSMPYNSGMVDVDLLYGSFLTDRDNDSLQVGIQELKRVTEQGTATNRAKAYHQLAQTYLRRSDGSMAEVMLDSLYMLLSQSDAPIYISVDYEPIINYYLRINNHHKGEQYGKLMLNELRAFKARKLNFNLVESIVDLQTEQKNQELKIIKLRETNQRLLFIIISTISIIVIVVVVVLVFRQKRYYQTQMRRANEKSDTLTKELKQSNIEKEKITQEIKDFLKDNDNRQELETLTPFILKKDGEIRFRQCFELLYPHFLYRLRERIPSITRREELLSMLIVLKQNNKEIAELLSIAPRSVLMLRHRFRQKLGLSSEYSLENFIEDTLGINNGTKELTQEATTPSDESPQA